MSDQASPCRFLSRWCKWVLGFLAVVNLPHAPSYAESLQEYMRQTDVTSSRTVSVPTSGPITIGVQDTILLALENNQDMRVQKLNPPIRSLGVDSQLAAFDPKLGARVSYSRGKSQTDSPVDGKPVKTSNHSTDGNISITEFLPTGTNISLDLSANRNWSSTGGDNNTANVDLAITQALLQGWGLSVNLASLRQARLDTQISEYELRGFAQTLVAQSEQTYWDYVLAQIQIKIFTDSLILAQDQLREVEERIAVGKVADVERAPAEAEVALREENLINARSSLATTRLGLLRTINPPSEDLWTRDIACLDQPIVANVRLDTVESHVQLAMRMRPDLNQARLGLVRDELELVKTRNGLLPRLDMFINLGRTGYADSFAGSVRSTDGYAYNGSVGLDFAYPIFNRGPRAQHARASLSLDQAQEALENLKQTIQVDIRSAYIEITRLQEQIAATAVTRKSQEESLRAETEKFRVGRSTSLLVAAAQRNLLSAQIDEVRAVVGHLKALVDLYRLEGSILERRGISAPGGQPVNELAVRKAQGLATQ